MNNTIFSIMFVSIIRLSIPIIIAALGNIFSVQVGVMNLGAEGMMISGAFFAALFSYLTDNAWIGVLAGILGGMIIGMIHSLICVEFGGIQNISGLGLNTFAAGITSFLCRSIFDTSLSPSVQSIQTTPIMSKIPFLGNLLAQFSPIFYLLIIVFIFTTFLLSQTVIGTRMKAVGSSAQTVETAGIDVWKLRSKCVLTCGGLIGLAGAYLSIGQLNTFMEGMTQNKGMLAVIAVTIGRRKPIRTLVVALMFGFFDALQLQIQMNNVFGISAELIQTIPYVVAIVALLFDTGKRDLAIDFKPYLKNKYSF